MAFADRLKEARLKKGYTQEQIAEKIGVAKSTYTGYEKGNREPNVYTIGKLMEELGVDANFLWQDDAIFPFELTYDEMENLVKKYRELDKPGQKAVIAILENEYERCHAFEQYILHGGETIFDMTGSVEERNEMIFENMNEISAKKLINLLDRRDEKYGNPYIKSEVSSNSKDLSVNAAHADDYMSAPDELKTAEEKMLDEDF